MRKVILNDVINIISGGTPKTDVEQYWNGEIGWLSVVDFNNDNRYVYSSEKSITPEGMNNSSTKLLNIGDVIISARGTVGALAQIGRPMCFNQSCFGLRGKQGIITNDYLYYALKNYISNVRKRTQGSVFETINLLSFKLMDITIHDKIEEQSKISYILGLLDNKIELNNKINQELEQMAKTLYDYWFVQFDFPDEKGRPYKSANGKMVYNEVLKREIPENWTNGKLSDISDTQTGYAFKSSEWKDSGHPVLTIKAIENNSINMSEASYIENYKEKYAKYSVSNGNIILAMTGNTIGKIGIIASDIKNVLINQRVCIYKTNYSNIAYLYFNLLSEGLQKKIWQIAQNSSQPNVSEEQLNLLPIVLPPKELLNKYNEKFSCYFKRIVSNNIENQQLSKLRNFLLPLLMNGQVTVNPEH